MQESVGCRGGLEPWGLCPPADGCFTSQPQLPPLTKVLVVIRLPLGGMMRLTVGGGRGCHLTQAQGTWSLEAIMAEPLGASL